MSQGLIDKLHESGCIRLLSEEGVAWTGEMAECLLGFVELVKEWNAFASLVSKKDIGVLAERHVGDALSLIGLVVRECGEEGTLLDIGSGGGFPAIPIKVVVPGIRVCLVERNGRKVGFLRKVVGALGLRDMEVVQGEFPGGLGEERPDVITARAVERPEKVFRGILAFMPPGCAFLCQSPVSLENLGKEFHVELVHDAWHEHGLRRGALRVVSRMI